jgi:O-antigen/teichoic acid export membrane protein
MNRVKIIAKNIFSLYTGKLISIILSVLLSIYIARFLGDILFGRYSFILAFVTLFSIFLDLGYETFLIREVSKKKSEAGFYINNIFGLRLILSLLVFGVIFLFINLTDFSENVKIIIYLFGIYEILISFSNVFKVTFRAFEKMNVEVGVTIISSVLRYAAGLIVLVLGYGLFELGLIFIVSGFFEFFISFFVCEKKFVRIKPIFHYKFFIDTIKIAFPIGLVTIFGLIYVKIDTIMLAFFKGEAVVGWYNAAYNLVLGFRPMPQLFMHALLPFMAYSFVKSTDSLRNVYSKSFKFLIFIGLPLSVGIFLLADRFILLFYGKNFMNSVVALQVLSWDVLLKFLYICIWFVLISANRQNRLALIAGAGALINIVLNLFLIPKFSFFGAAVATILTETFILLTFFYLAWVNNFKIPILNIVPKPVFACLVMAAFILYFNSLNIYFLIPISILIYLVIFYLIKGFSPDELHLIKNMFKGTK